MKLLTLLPTLLAATVFAADASSSSSSSTSASSSSSSSSASSSPSASPDPTPVGETWTAKWTDDDLLPYTRKCVSVSTITAEIYTLGEMYPSLKQFAAELKVFYHKQLYPGSWNGEDKHGNERELLKMDYEALPYAVREWLTRNPNQRHFSVQEEVVFFAPGAIYPILPLWVEEPEGESVGECEGVYEDLENYSVEPKEGVVLGKLEHKKSGKHDVQITVWAFQVKKKSEQERDEL